MRAIGVSHTACKDEFRRNLRSHSWSVFSFFIIYNIALPYVWRMAWSGLLVLVVKCASKFSRPGGGFILLLRAGLA